MSFAVAPGVAAYLPLRHDYTGAPDQLDREASLAKLKPLLESEKHAKVGHHLKYDAHVLRATASSCAACATTRCSSRTFQQRAARTTWIRPRSVTSGIRTIHYEDVAGKGAKQIPFSQVAVEQASEYSAEDVGRHAAPAPGAVAADLARCPRSSAVRGHRAAAGAGAARAWKNTACCSTGRCCARRAASSRKRLMEVLGEAHKEAGAPFNLDSPKQLGNDPVREDAAAGVAQDAHRPALDRRGRARGARRELRAAEARSSSTAACRSSSRRTRTNYPSRSTRRRAGCTPAITRPWPRRAGCPRRIRTCRTSRSARPRAVASARRSSRPGHVLLAADYSQIELRIMAHLSGDEGLLSAFASDQDIHQATAAEVFGTPVDDVTADQRRSAKAINFGLIYGMRALRPRRAARHSRAAPRRSTSTCTSRVIPA